MKTYKEFMLEARIKFGSVPPVPQPGEKYRGEATPNHPHKAGDKVVVVGSPENEGDTQVTKATHQHATVVARRTTNPDHVYVKRANDKYPVAYHFGNVHAAGEGDNPYQSMKSPEEKARDEYFKKKNTTK